MGQFGVNDLENYGNTQQSSFFSLKNDGDVANVRVMYNNIQDVNFYAVHEVDIEGRKRSVNCLRSYNEPQDKCPLCSAGYFQKAKLYIPLYDTKENTIKIWERGKKFATKITGMCSRYANAKTPLVAHTFDIERHGKAGDTQTTYEMYETGADDCMLEDLPEVPKIIGGIVLDKTANDMRYFLENGTFPNSQKAVDEQVDMPVGRRTPSNNRRGDAF